ncbi:hypothetical protein SAMN05216241_107120 [Limimonas halophila]|uniref:Uncharacterized protein n=1 Tax=Limimonas halophila TaxID=1082479 RepID=A0A1G7SRP2_9PROT|nr:hypothetical protein [Limimonas halophila]SDG25628.1 hypothetical protein SAMN05216241_107120 [Limimonas halophila]
MSKQPSSDDQSYVALMLHELSREMSARGLRGEPKFYVELALTALQEEAPQVEGGSEQS